MIGTRTVYHAPTDIAAAVDLLAANSTAMVIGGGTITMPRLIDGRWHPEHLVDTTALGLDRIHVEYDGTVTIGAAVTYSKLSAAASAVPGLLGLVASGITGGPQIRNQATIGGAACYANPASDIPTALVALDARLTLHGHQSVRTVAASDFFQAPFRTSAHRAELLTGIAIPAGATANPFGYIKLKRSESSWPLAVCAARLPDPTRCTLVIGAATPTPITIDLALDPEIEHLSPEQTAAVRDHIDATIDTWWFDELGTAAYRRHIAGVAATRALDQALRRARAQGGDQ
ncbi:FAD binding domain-containing protein [Streptomyces mirabilis]